MAWFWGSSQSSTEKADGNSSSQAGNTSVKDNESSRSGCPVKMGRSGKDGEAGSCPVPEEHRKDHPMIFLDPRNNMRAGGESQ